MGIQKDGARVFRTKTREAEKIYETIDVVQKTISTGLEIVVQTSKSETIKFSGSRSLVVANNLTDEEEYEIHKDLFLDCAADIVTAGHSVFKQWNRLPRSGWPSKLGGMVEKPGGRVEMDNIEDTHHE